MGVQGSAAGHKPPKVVKYFSPAEVAERWSCTPRWVYKLIREGELFARKIGRLQRIPDTAVYQYEARQQPSTLQTGSGTARPE